MAIDFQSVAQIIAGRGLNTVVEGSMLAGLSWGFLRCFGGRSFGLSSMTRFAVWFSTLVVIAGLPLLGHSSSTLVAPKIRVPELTLSATWATGLSVAWAMIAGGLLIRLGFSLWHVYRLRRECREIDVGAHILSALPEVLQRCPRIRRPRILVSDNVRVPSALGFFRPAIVIPAWALRELSGDELKVIVLHELAHLRRWDDWTNLAQKVVKALFFFHPAVWWIDSRLALEREIACDDMVLEQSASARTYAASLVSVAEKVVTENLRMRKARALRQSALGRVREVSHRITQILDNKRTRTNRGWRAALAIIGTLAMITVGAVPYAPELISFQSKVQPEVTAGASSVSSSSVKSASLRWMGRNSSALLRTSAGRSSANRSRAVSGGTVIRARAMSLRPSRKPKVTMATAKVPVRTRTAETLLVLHSAQFDESDSMVWSLTVWRVTTADGEQQTLRETIVMNSL